MGLFAVDILRQQLTGGRGEYAKAHGLLLIGSKDNRNADRREEGGEKSENLADIYVNVPYL